MRFRLGQGTSEEEFLAADRRLAEEFADHQPVSPVHRYAGLQLPLAPEVTSYRAEVFW